MKASELRIGNIVRFADKDEAPVLSEDIYNFAYGQLELEPIPLTEEWLMKLGFTNAEKVMSVQGSKGMFFKQVSQSQFITTDLKTGWEMCHKEQGGKIVPTPCPQLKYVHQLQNLYFALTGTELEIKN